MTSSANTEAAYTPSGESASIGSMGERICPMSKTSPSGEAGAAPLNGEMDRTMSMPLSAESVPWGGMQDTGPADRAL